MISNKDLLNNDVWDKMPKSEMLNEFIENINSYEQFEVIKSYDGDENQHGFISIKQKIELNFDLMVSYDFIFYVLKRLFKEKIVIQSEYFIRGKKNVCKIYILKWEYSDKKTLKRIKRFF